MGNITVLVLMMTAFGLTDSRRMFRKCTFCRYFFESGNSPYALLRILSEEISSYLSEDQVITLLLDEEDLLKAELVFELYCKRTCTGNSVSPPTELPDAKTDALPDSSHNTSDADEAPNEPLNESTTPSPSHSSISSLLLKIITLLEEIKIAAGREASPEVTSEIKPISTCRPSRDVIVGTVTGKLDVPDGISKSFSGTPCRALGGRTPDALVPGCSSPGHFEATFGTFSDNSDENVNKFEELLRRMKIYPHAAVIPKNGNAAYANKKFRTTGRDFLLRSGKNYLSPLIQ